MDGSRPWSPKTASIIKRDKCVSHNGRTQRPLGISLTPLSKIECESDQTSREAKLQEI